MVSHERKLPASGLQVTSSVQDFLHGYEMWYAKRTGVVEDESVRVPLRGIWLKVSP